MANNALSRERLTDLTRELELVNYAIGQLTQNWNYHQRHDGPEYAQAAFTSLKTEKIVLQSKISGLELFLES